MFSMFSGDTWTYPHHKRPETPNRWKVLGPSLPASCCLSYKNCGSDSIGMKSSCSAASLVLSTSSATNPSPHYNLMWDHFKTICGKAYNGILAEKLLANLQGSLGLVHTTDARNLSFWLKVIELVDLTTCKFSVSIHCY